MRWQRVYKLQGMFITLGRKLIVTMTSNGNHGPLGGPDCWPSMGAEDAGMLCLLELLFFIIAGLSLIILLNVITIMLTPSGSFKKMVWIMMAKQLDYPTWVQSLFQFQMVRLCYPMLDTVHISLTKNMISLLTTSLHDMVLQYWLVPMQVVKTTDAFAISTKNHCMDTPFHSYRIPFQKVPLSSFSNISTFLTTMTYCKVETGTRTATRYFYFCMRR